MKPFARMILALSLALAAGCASTLKVDNAPVSVLDLDRYLGECPKVFYEPNENATTNRTMRQNQSWT